MIFQTEVTEYTGDVFKNLGAHVINTDRIAKHRAVNGSSSSFYYTDRGMDRRRKPMPAKCGSTPAQIQTAMDSALMSNTMELDVFINNDITKTTEKKYINYGNFIFATPHRLNANYSLVTIVEGFKIEKYLVNASLADLVIQAGLGTTTTSTTSTSTTSTTTTTTSTTSTTIAPITPTLELTDGVDTFRLNVRSGELNLDQTITPLGFVGSEPGDWDTINTWA